ncbi:MAG: alpha/beta hydrolase, partial [Steroidobacteraceae bacterium]
TVIAHSFGGRCTMFACKSFPELINHAVIVDSRLASKEDPMKAFQDAWRPKKIYERLEDIIPRFRLRPDEPCPALTKTHLALMSVKQQNDGYTWKFDENVSRVLRNRADTMQLELEELRDLPMPVDVITGEKSIVCTRRRGHRMVELVKNARGPIIIPTAYHHIPIGQPIAMLAALQGVLAVHNGARYKE